MPRRGRSVRGGRVDRNNRRDDMRLRRSLANVVNNNIDDDNNIDELNDNFKIALNLNPRNFESFNCGSMSLCCSLCSAKHFAAEVTSGNTDSFSLCCHKGKVHIPPLSANSFFKDLFNGLISSDSAIKNRSKNYFDNIRSFNFSFAMISSEAKLSDSVMSGVYNFKIHDVFYHRAGSIIPEDGRDPIYAQLYFYDVDTANQHRMRVSANASCDSNLMRQISLELDRVNPFIRSFKKMAEVCQEPGNELSNISMVIKVNNNSDMRRFNDAVHTDVAAIFKTTV